MSGDNTVRLVKLWEGGEIEFVLQRVSDDHYVSKSGEFTETDLRGENTMHYASVVRAVKHAIALGYDVMEE